MVLSGDGEDRLEAAAQVFRQGGAPLLVCSGGVDDPPHSLPAKAMKRKLVEKGIAPGRVLVEPGGQNTREQAVNVVKMAETNEWHRLLIVASPYHQYRAFLTFVKALDERGMDEVHLIPVASAQSKWWGISPGLDKTRVELLGDEFRKIDEYQKKGHVASYADGLAYLERWESMGVET